MSDSKPFCVFCSKKSGSLRSFTLDTLAKCKNVLSIRQEHQLYMNEVRFPADISPIALYHSQCYRVFTALPKKYRVVKNDESLSEASAGPRLSSAHLKNDGTFPKHLIFGAATSAYQTEGAWNVDGKGESIWDHFVHQKPSPIVDNSTGDIACDSYYRYKEDIRLAENLGISLYRFSISWSRVLPTGYSDVINEKGLQYYKNLVEEIRCHNMIPAATLFHFDLPQKLFEDGIDWRNPELVEHFVNYSRIIIQSLPEVEVWFTINEPRQVCLGGYGTGLLAPGVKSNGNLQYQCNYVILKAHAAVYHMYKTEFPHYKAKMGLIVDCDWMHPKSNCPADKAAAERQLQFECGMYFHPIFVGDWPNIVKERIHGRSIRMNITKPRLPVFTEQEISYIKGTHDFLGLCIYYTLLTEDEIEAPYNETSYLADTRVAAYFDPSWLTQSNNNFATVPFGAYEILKWIQQQYDNPEILIAEIGMTDDGSNLNDVDRIDFYTDYFCYILKAIQEGVDVTLISFWSLIDTFEWVFGYGLASAHLKNDEKFPKHLIFGAATSAYQIEGAWNVDGRGESIWDHYVHQIPSPVVDNSTGDIACDSYYKYKEDVALAENLGVSLYRFSISWSRVLPTGYSDVINEKGLQYYKNLVEEIRCRNMIPAATLYHFDLPQKLYEDCIDWRNPELVEHFVKYCRIVIQSLPEVGLWFTINEPRQVCLGGYGAGVLAPGLKSNGDLQYQCNYVILKAHAAVYRMYKTEFPHYKAKMGIIVDCDWMHAKTNSPADKAAAERQLQFECGMYFHPIFIGDWPEIVKERIHGRSIKMNITKPRLPVFNEEEIAHIKGTHDFLGLNHYYTVATEDVAEAPYTEISYLADLCVADSFYPSWLSQSNGNFATVPFGAHKILKWLKEEYDNPEILITEIGMTDDGTSLNDVARIEFYTDYFCYILKAIQEGVDVTLITFWSLIDAFEWAFGYGTHFGLYHVNFTDPNRARTPKTSVEFVQNLTKSMKLSCRTLRILRPLGTPIRDLGFLGKPFKHLL